MMESLKHPKNRITISDKIFTVLGETKYTEDQDNIKTYPDNNKPLSILFILGFLLGDGNFSMRIRDSKNGVWFIPVIRLEQKYTLDNNKTENNLKFSYDYWVKRLDEIYVERKKSSSTTLNAPRG